MPTLLIQVLAFGAIGIFVWWAMWREDFDGMRTSYRYNHDLKTRRPMTVDEFYREFYFDSGLEKEFVERFLRFESSFWEADAQLVRPQDNHLLINGDPDAFEYLRAIENEFGIAISREDCKELSGEFDRLIHFVYARCGQVA